MSPKYTDINQPVIERCKNGDKSAYAELYHLYAKAMLNVSIRILNNKEEAEDVLQDAFIKAFSNIKNFDGRFSFGVWLKRIVINQSIDVLKKKRIIITPIEDRDFPQEEIEEDPEIMYDINAIRNNLLKLPDGYRTILSLYLIEDLNHKEIAEMLNISESTSKSQYHRARKKLAELIIKNTTTND